MRLPSVLYVLALIVALPLQARAADAPEMFRIFSAPVKASSLMGREVRNPRGEYVGTVGDLVFDLQHNRTPHAILDLQHDRAAYPMHALKLPRGSSYIVLEASGDHVAQQWDDTRLMPAHALMGRTFRLRNDAGAGTVVDVVLDAFWGNVAFAVVRLAGDAQLRPVPLDAFYAENGRLILRLEREAIEALPGFTPQHLDAHVADVEFLQRTARLAHGLTPIR